MPLINNGGATGLPADLLKDVSSVGDLNKYVDVVITDLDVDTVYSMQFAWVYEDKSVSQYSSNFDVRTAAETEGTAPSFTANDLAADAGLLAITWDGNDELGSVLKNFDRVEYYIADSQNKFGNGTTPSGYLKSKGTVTVAAPPGTYEVWLVAISSTGKKSPESSHQSATVTVAATPIDPPTKPSGLTVEEIPFGLAVNWAGTYTGSGFSGFKSINIYASTSSTTSSFTGTQLVGHLTVDKIVNRLNISLDSLRQATSTTGSDIYTTDIYLYYISTNQNDLVYKENGSPVYTLINSSPVHPKQANLIDLENGIISIENLVAGNGQFSSWLRAGTAGGARIELNGGSSFINNGHAVLPGLSVYDSGGQSIFRASLDGIVKFGGYAPSDLVDIATLSPVSDAATQAAADAAAAAAKAQNYDSLGNIDKSITINSYTGSIKAGKTSYLDSSHAGFFLGFSADNIAKFRIGNADNTKSLDWDGSSLTIKGSLESSTFSLNGHETYNYWNAGGFNAGNAKPGVGTGAYININVATDSDKKITLYASDYQNVINEGGGTNTGDTDTGTTEFQISVAQKIVLDSSQVTIQGLPGVGNGLTAIGSLEYYGSGAANTAITQYANYTPSQGYGAAARYRTVVADPYHNNELRRGFGVYYGVRNSAPGSSTGFVGDIWISW